MAQVISAIIAQDFQELRRKIKAVAPYSQWVQLDIMDGRFVADKTWNNPEDLEKIKTSVRIEAHLMIENPDKVIVSWLKAVQRVIVHWESPGRDKIEFNKKIGIALNPDTPWSEIAGLISQIGVVLLMAVRPGAGRQKFLNGVLPKIQSLRSNYPNVKIEVDGGINPETGKRCLDAGADILVSGSYIFGAKNIRTAIEDLKNLV